MDVVVELSMEDLNAVRRMIEGGITARVAIDGDRFKISVDHGMWTPGLGTKQD